MEFWEVIKKRRCIRKYKDKEVPDEDIKKIIEAGTLAPSEGNVQPWRFIVVKNRKIKTKMEEVRFSSHNRLTKTGAVIVVCIDLDLAQSKYGERGLELYSKQSTAAATENMFLAATEMGIGACWMGAFDEEKIKKILNLEDNLRPVVLMPVGYADEKGTDWGRKSVDEVTKFVE